MELESVYRVIHSKSDDLSNSTVKVVSENKNVSHILQVGSKKPDLQDIAVNIHEVCELNRLSVQPVWVPRHQNRFADSVSRVADKDVSGLNKEGFLILQKHFGTNDIDLFATDYDKKCQTFSSKFWCPGTSSVDAFSFLWCHGNNYLVPPPKTCR